MSIPVKVPVRLRALLDEQAMLKGMRYRDYLLYLAEFACEAGYKPEYEPIKVTRLELPEELDACVTRLAKEAGVTKQDWLLQVFKNGIATG